MIIIREWTEMMVMTMRAVKMMHPIEWKSLLKMTILMRMKLLSLD